MENKPKFRYDVCQTSCGYNTILIVRTWVSSGNTALELQLTFNQPDAVSNFVFFEIPRIHVEKFVFC